MLPAKALINNLSTEKNNCHTSANSVFLDFNPVLEGLKILIVDDEVDTLYMLKVALEQYSAEVRTKTSVREAMESLLDWTPNLLVSDIGMPGEDGYDLIRRVRGLGTEYGKKIPAIALTAYSRSEDRIKVLSAGYQMHLAKPIDPTELAAVIASISGRLSAS